MRCHRRYWADGTGAESQPQLPEPHSGRIYCPQTITLFFRLLTSFCGKLWQQGHKLHFILDLSPFGQLFAQGFQPCTSCWALTPLCQPFPQNSTQRGGDGHSQYSGFGKPVTSGLVSPIPTSPASLRNSLQFLPLLVGSAWFVLHSVLLMCRTLRLETFLRYKLCLGAYRTNNHKLFGRLLHLWLHFLCSQRAERIPCKIQLCCICV